MGTEDVQTVRDGPNPIRLKTSCREYPDVRITQVHGPEGGSYQRVRIWEAGRFPVSSAKGGRMHLLCTQWYALALLPFAFALHPSLLSIDRPVIDHSSWQTTPSSVAYRPPSGPRLPDRLSSPVDGCANRPLTLSFTIKKVIDYIDPHFT